MISLQIILGPRLQVKKPVPVEIVVPPSEPEKDDEAEISDEVVDTSLIIEEK
jgi:hypothetical protein